MKNLIILLLPFLLGAIPHGLRVLPEKKRYNLPKKITPRNIRTSSVNLDELVKQNKKIAELLKRKLSKPLVVDLTASYNLPTGTILRGIILNSVLSTNLATPLKVKIKSPPLKNTTLNCMGVVLGKRIHTTCPSLIIAGVEHASAITLLNLDGSAGLIGRYFAGAEKALASTSASSILQGLTNLGSSTLKGSLIDSGKSVLNSATELIGEEQTKSAGIVMLPSGTPVLLYFNQGLKK